MKSVQLIHLLLLQVLLLVSCSAQTCGPGTFLEAATCTECAPGSYQYQTNADSCIPCRAGTFSPGYGAQVANLCKECPENTVSSSAAGTCTPCPAESYANRDKTKCINCPPGQGVSDDQCSPCRAGFFRPDRSVPYCTACPNGYTSEKGATSCKKMPPCPLGYQLDFKDCHQCFSNYFRGDGMEMCEKCPPYTVSPRGAAKCNGCPAGQFFKDSRCESCPSGTKTVGKGGIVCRIDGALCPVAYFEKHNGDCHTCYPGYRLDLLTNSCKKCAENEYSPGGVVINCEKCPSGMIGIGASCTCPAGRRLVNGRCILCSAGTYRSLSPHLAIDECRDCFHPVFSETYDVSSADRSTCESCPGITITTDGISCITPTPRPPCPDGLVRQGLRSDLCVSAQTGCRPGLVPKIGSDGYRRGCVKPDGTVPCPKGTIRKGNRCLSCHPGGYLRTAPSGRVYCTPCPKNAFSPGGVVYSCTTCPNNFRRARDFVSCSCTARNARGHFIDSNGRCTKCPAGTYANNNRDEEIHECKPCPAGTFSDESGQTSCTLCPANMFSDRGATQCRACPAGTVSYGVGEASCVPVLGDSCVEFTKVLSCGSLASRGKCVIQTQKRTCIGGRPSTRIYRDTILRKCADVRECAILSTQREDQ